MQVPVAADVFAIRRDSVVRPARLSLIVLSALAVATVSATISRGGAAVIEPDLMRVLRFMAALKGGFAIIALATCFWRLARPAPSWRTGIYVAGPPLMIAGAGEMWSLHHLGASAFSLHVGLFAVLAAALTDQDFLSSLRWRSDRRR